MSPAGPALTWAALAAAVLLAGAPAARGRRRRVKPRGSHGAETSGPVAGIAGVVGAVVAVALACIALAGPLPGSLAALGCCPLAGVGLRHLQRRPARAGADPALPVTLDLTAAALRSGRPLAAALTLAAPAARADVAADLRRVAGLLRLGADPAQAWHPVTARDGPLHDVARVATRSATSGARIAGAFVDLAEQLRRERGAALAVRANRAGITAMAPLAACYLPSFVCLGVVPAVVGIAKTTVGVLP